VNKQHQNCLPLGSHLHEYVIEEVLGMGTFGITYKARDTHLGMLVVIKEYLPEFFAKRSSDNRVLALSNEALETFEWGRERFLDEAKILAKFRHPNIVRVVRYFKANDTAYFVMDFEEGNTLQSVLLQSTEPLNEASIKDIFTQVLSGLKAVHEQKYLHRDIKPGNIFLREDKTVILIDFGAARLEMPGGGNATVMVTPGYAPVEQYVPDGKQGPWSDIYAVGATLYRCLTSKSPVLSIERMQVIDEDNSDPCPRLLEQASQLGSKDFLETIDWMLSVLPEERPQSVDDVLDAWAGKMRGSKPLSANNDYQPKQAKKNYKILIASTTATLKSAAIQSISGSTFLSERKNSPDFEGGSKMLSKVDMDYGSLNVTDNERILLYGIPSSEHFNSIWEILKKGAIGLLLLIDNGRPNPLGDLENYVELFGEFIDKTGVVIGIVQTERYPLPDIHDYQLHLQKIQFSGRYPPPIMEVDPENHDEMKKILLSLIFHIDPGVKEFDA